MANTIKTEVSIETRPALVAYPLRDSFRTWCEHCPDVVHAIEHESAQRLLRVSAAGFEELIETERLHSIEVGLRSSLICGNSLSTIATFSQ